MAGEQLATRDQEIDTGPIIQAIGQGVLRSTEMDHTRASFEITTAYDPYYQLIPKDQIVLETCSDDRGPTPDCLEALAAQGIEAIEGYLRAFGGAGGETKLFLAMILASQPEGEIPFGGEFMRAQASVVQAYERIKVALLNHSDADKEAGQEDPTALSTADSEQPLGCLWMAKANVVDWLKTTHENSSDVQAQAANLATFVLGPDDADPYLNAAIQATHQVQEAFGTPGDGFTRQDLLDAKQPVVVLAGEHSPAAKIVINLSPDEMSNPTAANQAEAPFYGVDLARRVQQIQEAFPEFPFNKKDIAAWILLDVAATQWALSGGEPKKLPIVFRGSLEDFQASLAA